MSTEPPGARANLEIALNALARGHLEEALELSRRLLEGAPDDPAFLQLAATVALAMDRAEDALRSARASLARRPDHAPTHILAGRAARLKGDLEGALTSLRRAVSLEPGRAEPSFLLCVTLLEVGDKEATAVLHFLLENFPNDSGGWRMLGDALFAVQKLDAALVAYGRATQGAGATAAHLRRAGIFESQARYSEALAEYRAAAACAPELAEVTYRRALCLKRVNEMEGARRAFEEAARHGPSGPTAALASFELGLIEQDCGNFPAAVGRYEDALERRPDLAEAAVNLGICLQEMGDMAGAKQAYARALSARTDTFGRIAQALASSPTGELWLDHQALRRSLQGISATRPKAAPIDSGFREET